MLKKISQTELAINTKVNKSEVQVWIGTEKKEKKSTLYGGVKVPIVWSFYGLKKENISMILWKITGLLSVHTSIGMLRRKGGG